MKNKPVSPHKCNDCGSDLILIEETTTLHDNNLYPITKSVYLCSNSKCQAEADRRSAKRLELKKEQEELRQKRVVEKLKFLSSKTAPA